MGWKSSDGYYSGDYYSGWSGWSGGSWFRENKKRKFDYWRPKYVQPDAACFVQDAWTQRQGQKAQDLYHQSFDDEVDAGDFFSVAFEPYPEFAERTSRPKKRHFCAAVMDHPAYAALRSQTRLDVAASHVAAAKLGELYKQVRDATGGDGEGEGDSEGDQQGEPKKGKGKKGNGDPNGRQPGQGLSDEEKKEIEDQVDKAMGEAQKALDDSRELADAFGTRAGTGQGTPSQQEIEKFLKIYETYKANRWLQRIIKFAGRLRHIARARQKARTRYGADAVKGVETGDSIERLLPDELGQLAMGEAELDVMARIIEGEAQCLETYGTSDAAQGPVILLVDESGSMGGLSTSARGKERLQKFEQAMGLALTTVWIARKQRRWVGLYTFCAGKYTRKLILDPNASSEHDSQKLYEWITTFNAGGTDSYVQCRMVVDDVEAGLLGKVKGKADILVITDGDISPNDGRSRDHKTIVEEYAKWRKKHQIKCKGLMVGTRSPGLMADLADELHYADDMHEASEIAEAVFSL